MIRLVFLFLCAAAMASGPAHANDKSLTLSVPDALEDSGLWKFVLPRFSLKTGVRVTLGPDGGLALSETATGPAVLQQGAVIYRLGTPDGAAATRFADWLRSDIGRSTIESYAPPDGAPAIRAPNLAAAPVAETVFEGDIVLGETLSLRQCGRCHVVNAKNRMNGLGSTPSFALMRTFPDWEDRFTVFYVLKPHAAFTQIPDITPPFDETRPSPIAPVVLSLDDLDAILAYVAMIPPANLGAPIQHQ